MLCHWVTVDLIRKSYINNGMAVTEQEPQMLELILCISSIVPGLWVSRVLPHPSPPLTKQKTKTARKILHRGLLPSVEFLVLWVDWMPLLPRLMAVTGDGNRIATNG